jgi:F-box and leucine-rich repeat protein 10/11
VTNKKVKPEAAPVSSSSGIEDDQTTAPYFPTPRTHLLDEEPPHHKLDEGLSTVQSPPEDRPVQLDPSYALSPSAKINGDADQPANLLVSPPTSLAGEAEVLPPDEHGHHHDELHNGGSVLVDGETEILHTPTSSSRHSSRQPRQVDRYVPETQAQTQPTSKPPPALTPFSRQTIRSSTKKPSSSSRPSSSHTKKSASPSLEKKHATHSATSSRPSSSHHGSTTSKSVKRERTSFTAEDTDAESLRLIREIQEQEFGLRRRTTRV